MLDSKNFKTDETIDGKKGVKKRIRLGVIFGGESAERDISIESTKGIVAHLNSEKYEVLPIGIDPKGEWHFFKPDSFFLALKQGGALSFFKEKTSQFSPLFDSTVFREKSTLFSFFQSNFDLIFPMLHGPLGEDGTIQGFLELINLPYVGCGVLSASICMDKGMMKQILRANQIPTCQHLMLNFKETVDVKKIVETIGFPLFVKPNQMGSSIGVSKVFCLEALFPAIEKAFQFDERVLVEPAIDGREIECAVLGNENPEVSFPGEVIPKHSFYSYEAKYLDQNGADFVIPAQLEKEKILEVKGLALRAFQALRCEGMARVDFFLKRDGTLLINELNTIPGFTSISLYPRLWEVSGISYSDLLDRLIHLSILRYQRKKNIRGGRGLKGVSFEDF